ncbi:unnamed protein product [Trichobilharzia regenti]|nr:unnamed protein product [Trichobilharzia regenti]
MTFGVFVKSLSRFSRRVPYHALSNKPTKWFSQMSSNAVKDSEIIPPSFCGSNEKEYPKHIHDIVDRISALSLLEVAELSELLQKKLNIKSSGPMMPMMAQAPTNQSPEEPEEQQAPTKMSFSVKIVKFDAAKKIQLIKEIKQSTPANVKTDVPKEEAEQIKKILEEAGASVVIE